MFPKNNPILHRPRVTFGNFRNASFEDFYADAECIWGRDAQERNVHDLYLHVADHGGRLQKAVRHRKLIDIVQETAHIAIWMFTFMAGFQRSHDRTSLFLPCVTSPSDILWWKYPGTCPGCFDAWLFNTLKVRHPRDVDHYRSKALRAIMTKARAYQGPVACTCPSRMMSRSRQHEHITRLRQDLDQYRRSYGDQLRSGGKQVGSLAQWEQMFQDIFGGVHHFLSLEAIAARLQEEIGKLGGVFKDCYTYDHRREPYTPQLLERRQERMTDQLADVFSWLIATALKVKATDLGAQVHSLSPLAAVNGDLSLAAMLWFTYGTNGSGANYEHLKCPGCNCAPCECSRDFRLSLRSQVTPVVYPTPDQTATGSDRDLVFFSYSHLDRTWLERIETVLKPLIHKQVISPWDDRKIGAGDLWREEIISALDRAKVAVLLVTPQFLASDFIAQNELPPLLAAARSKGTRIIWIPVSASMYEETELAKYQAVHDPALPLDSLNHAECNAALVRIGREIKKWV